MLIMTIIMSTAVGNAGDKGDNKDDGDDGNDVEMDDGGFVPVRAQGVKTMILMTTTMIVAINEDDEQGRRR
jgi:hypothetical protein